MSCRTRRSFSLSSLTPIKSPAQTAEIKTMLKTPEGSVDEVLEQKNYVQKNKLDGEKGKHANVFFVNKENNSPEMYAVKAQQIKSPKNIADRVYRELRIFQTLLNLESQQKSCNFVRIVDWFKGTPLILSPRKSSNSGFEMMNYVLEYADLKALNSYQEMSFPTFQSVLFQSLFALHVSSTECGFVHNDLHLGNILLQSMPTGKKFSTFYDDKSNVWFTGDCLVKLTDFGLSSICLPNGEILSNPATAINNITDDVVKLFQEVSRLNVNWKENKENYDKFKKLRKRVYTDLFTPEQALNSYFFNNLKKKPNSWKKEESIRVSILGKSVFTPTPTKKTTKNFIFNNNNQNNKKKENEKEENESLILNLNKKIQEISLDNSHSNKKKKLEKNLNLKKNLQETPSPLSFENNDKKKSKKNNFKLELDLDLELEENNDKIQLKKKNSSKILGETPSPLSFENNDQKIYKKSNFKLELDLEDEENNNNNSFRIDLNSKNKNKIEFKKKNSSKILEQNLSPLSFENNDKKISKKKTELEQNKENSDNNNNNNNNINNNTEFKKKNSSQKKSIGPKRVYSFRNTPSRNSSLKKQNYNLNQNYQDNSNGKEEKKLTLNERLALLSLN